MDLGAFTWTKRKDRCEGEVVRKLLGGCGYSGVLVIAASTACSEGSGAALVNTVAECGMHSVIRNWVTVVGATILSVEGHRSGGGKYGKYTTNGIMELFLEKRC